MTLSLFKVAASSAALIAAGPALAGPDYNPARKAQYPSPNMLAPDADRITLRGTGSSGDGSGFCVKAPGSALCRTLADRTGDTLNVIDRGLDRTGATDVVAPLASALANASARNVGTEMPGGLYKLNAWVNPGLNQTLFVRDAKFNGTGGVNSPDWQPYLAGVGAGWIRRTDKPGTEFGIVSSYTVEPSGTAPSYQKGAAYFSARQYDPSDYMVDGKPANQLRDLVGLQTTCEIAVGNLRGRCWGGASYAVGKPGSRGTLIGWESDIFKYDGVDQPLSDHFDTSIGILSVAFGGKATTAFAASAAEGGNWYHGFTTRQGEVLNTAFGVQKAGEVDIWNWRVTPDGKMTSQDINAASLTSGGAVSATGGFFGPGVTVTGDNSMLIGSGSGTATANISTTNGPITIAASGTNRVNLGSTVQETAILGKGIITGEAFLLSKVGFNGNTPVGKCALSADLPTDGTASNAALATAINATRSCLATVGLGQ